MRAFGFDSVGRSFGNDSVSEPGKTLLSADEDALDRFAGDDEISGRRFGIRPADAAAALVETIDFHRKPFPVLHIRQG